MPADMRLFEAASLKIEEAALTGESVPVEKDVTGLVEADAGIGDRVNMAFQNSNVTYGRGLGCCCQYRYGTRKLVILLACFKMRMRRIHHSSKT